MVKREFGSLEDSKTKKLKTWESFKNAFIFIALIRDDSTNGYDTRGQRFYLKLHYEFQKMLVILFEDL